MNTAPSVFGIDPGQTVGYAKLTKDGTRLWGGESDDPEFVAFAVVGVDYIAIEGVTTQGGLLRSQLLLAAQQIGWFRRGFDLPVFEITRREMFLHFLGKVTGSDSKIRAALIQRYGEVGTAKRQGPLYGWKGHAFPALGVATVVYDQLQGNMGRGKRFAEAIRTYQDGGAEALREVNW